MSNPHNHFYEFGPFRADVVNGLLLRGAEVVTLQKRSFELLLFLLARSGQVVSKAELLAGVWPDSYVEESNLTQHIYALRKALGEAKGQPYILTVPKRGYRFTVEVTETRQAAPAPEPAFVEEHSYSRIVINETPATQASLSAVNEAAQHPFPVLAAAPLMLTASTESRAARGGLKLPVLLSLVLLVALVWSLTRSSPPPASPLNFIPLTSYTGRESEPALSADGKTLAFTWDGGVAPGGNRDLYVKLLSHGPPLRLTTDPAEEHSPAWSPDGQQLAFLRARGATQDVLLISALGGIERKVGEVALGTAWTSYRANRVDWSPDGDTLAVRHTPAGEKSAVFLLSLKTGEMRRLTTPPTPGFGDSYPVFSPDGEEIAFVRGVSSFVDGVFVVAVRGGEARALWPGSAAVTGLTWWNDGRSVLFSSNGVWRVAATGGEAERIVGFAANVYELATARGDGALAYTHREIETNFLRAELTGQTAPAPFADSSRWESGFNYSPDGRRIVFSSNRSGYSELWLADADGGNPTQFTHFNGPAVGSPQWSPDGQWIVFDSNAAGQSEIYVVKEQGGEPRRLTEDAAADVLPRWSRDGRRLYFCSNRSGIRQIWKLPFNPADGAGGAPVQVTQNGGYEGHESFDGQTLYFSKRSTDGLFALPVAGGSEQAVHELAPAGFHIQWTLHARGIYFIPHDEEPKLTLHFFDFAARRVSPVLALNKPKLNHGSFIAVSPDARWLVFEQLERDNGDILLVEHLR